MKKTHLIIVVLVFVAVLLGGYFGFKLYMENNVKKRLDAIIAEHADVADFTYRKVAVDLPGMDVRISDILVAPAGEKDKLKINEIIIHDFDEKSEIPQFLSISINGVEIDLNELGRNAEDLKELGYEGTIRINLGVAYMYKKEKKELNIDTLKVGIDDAGNLSIQLHVSNIGTVTNNLLSLLNMLSQLTVHEAKIVYKDKSLAERVLKAAAKKQNMTPEELKENLINHLNVYIGSEKDKYAKEILEKARNFIDNPDEFSISLVSEPISADKLMNEFQQVVKRYGRMPVEKPSVSVAQATGTKKLFRAIKSGELKSVKDLLGQGIDVDSTVDDGDFPGGTALMLASSEGHANIVKFLIEKGADVNKRIRPAGGITALMLASTAGQADIVRILLDNGAKADYKIEDGQMKGESAMTMARRKNHTEVIKLLKKAGISSGDFLVDPPYITKSKIFKTKQDMKIICLSISALNPMPKSLQAMEVSKIEGLISTIRDKDAWETPIMFQSDGKAFQVISYGNDKVPGGTNYDADIFMSSDFLDSSDIMDIDRFFSDHSFLKISDEEKVAATNSADSEKTKLSANTAGITASGIDIRSAFRRLENAGFKPGPYQEDDLSGLSEAVKRFQKFAKLEESGIIDASTWAKMKILYDPEASAVKGKK